MSMLVRIPQHIVPLEKKIKEGTAVLWGEQPIYEKSESALVIEVAQELKISPHDIFKYLHVSLGETVEKDTVIAEKKTVLSRTTLVAPSKVEVRAIDHDAGTITLVSRESSEAHFAFQGTFSKIDKQDLVFSVPEGTEYEVLTCISKTFGGKTACIEKIEEITLRNCEDKIIVTALFDTMSLSKIAALGPIAVVSFNAPYNSVDTVSLAIKQKADWQDLIKHKWPYALYIEGSKSVYFYRN
jgi:hypothetical protein